uniref:Uncharacterized protein n=1 Tax=Fagus sylvatica TaxID=28930 RepID=A0A2N9G5Y2_FAGSY
MSASSSVKLLPLVDSFCPFCGLFSAPCFFSLDLCGFLVHGDISSISWLPLGDLGVKPIKATPFEEPLQN